MDLKTAITTAPLILTEGSMFERLRRSPNVKLDPGLAHAALLYNEKSKIALEEAYRSYIEVGKKHDLPIILFSATWRANAKRIASSEYSGRDLNGDNIKFLHSLRESFGDYGKKIIIGGLMGCCGDAYKPSEALESDDAEKFHDPQAVALAKANVDFLFGSTLPSTKEAVGMARAMAKTGTAFILSFVVRPTGEILDGVALKEAINRIDSEASPRPFGYFVNCVHPSVFLKAFASEKDATWLSRVIGFQGNTSKKSPEELAELSDLDTSTPEALARDTAELRRVFGIKIIGGCCGTNDTHIDCLAHESVSMNVGL